jgi:1,4-alpha-glucan branching enzyme
LFKSGKHTKLYSKFGAHYIEKEGEGGTYFAVYAPAAREVQVTGNFNYWSGNEHRLFVRWDQSGIWEGFIPGVGKGELYKYKIYSNHDSTVREKADPYGLYFEQAPKTSSITWDTYYKWGDTKWMAGRKDQDPYHSPMSIYEVHLGSWKKNHEESRSLHYTEMADELVDYVSDMGYTHVEMLPVTEHPYYPSWGYLSTGFYAPTSRYGTPQEFMYLVDKFHQRNIGVILDWVPAHFPSDTSFLADFDGSAVYEHPNPKKGFHPDWNSFIFNFERPEICSFLLSSAEFWLKKYHIDGLRVDAVASMIYLDYSREDGQWDPNEFGGNENLDAIRFLKSLNQHCYEANPGIVMIAEESTAFQGVTAPVSHDGLGFGFKWMMGWMNDTLRYMERNPVHRKYHHNEISFSMAYAYSESYVLPLSHDEVVHGKNSIVYKMPGDEWKKFANLRLLYSYMYTHPGHKLLFMGLDIGQTSEWNVNGEIDWRLLDHGLHQGIQKIVRTLNQLYSSEAALYKDSFDPAGFEWIDHGDHQNSILSYLRKSGKELLVVVCNFTPAPHEGYRIGVPEKGSYKEIFNSDDPSFHGSGFINEKAVKADKIHSHGRDHSLELRLPPLGVTILKKKRKKS